MSFNKLAFKKNDGNDQETTRKIFGGKNKAQPWNWIVYLDIHFSPPMSN